MNLKIITHEKIIYEGIADEIVIQTESGQMGILKGHIPITTTLDIGVTKIKVEGKYKYFATLGGVFQFKDDDAIILADVCEDSSDIDVTRAKEAQKRAEARLADKSAIIDTQRAQLALAKAMARLKAALNK